MNTNTATTIPAVFDSLDDVLADAAAELRAIDMHALAHGVEEARAKLKRQDVPTAAESDVVLRTPTQLSLIDMNGD